MSKVNYKLLPKLEKYIEQKLYERITAEGYLCVKFNSYTFTDAPDRIVILQDKVL